jgi:shikimate dehydrogenase
MKITKQTILHMVIGDPITHSLSPHMHNAAYKALNIDHAYITCRVKPDDVEKAIQGIKSLKIKGISVTIPHKQTVIKYLDKVTDEAKKIGAVNTIVNDNGYLSGYNTDIFGAINPLKELTTLQDKSVAVLGAGGAARAVVYALTKQGAKVTIFNRTLDTAKKLAEDFSCYYQYFDKKDAIKDMDIIFNTTSVGLNNDETPLDKTILQKHHIVFDAVYKPYQTRLLKDAKERGAKKISGIEMLLHQGTAQFELFTGEKAPIETMRNALFKNI